MLTFSAKSGLSGKDPDNLFADKEDWNKFSSITDAWAEELSLVLAELRQVKE